MLWPSKFLLKYLDEVINISCLLESVPLLRPSNLLGFPTRPSNACCCCCCWRIVARTARIWACCCIICIICCCDFCALLACSSISCCLHSNSFSLSSSSLWLLSLKNSVVSFPLLLRLLLHTCPSSLSLRLVWPILSIAFFQASSALALSASIFSLSFLLSFLRLPFPFLLSPLSTDLIQLPPWMCHNSSHPYFIFLLDQSKPLLTDRWGTLNWRSRQLFNASAVVDLPLVHTPLLVFERLRY